MNYSIEISIVMLAYNHGKFLAQALDSILTQNILVQYEIIIGEDCSTDNTREIIFEYQKKYPDIIKPIIRSSNVGAPANFYEALLLARGAYVAILEGDDIWTDSCKLAVQYDFLRNNAEYIAVAHKNLVINKFGEVIGASSAEIPVGRAVGKKDLLKYTVTLAHPSSLFFRNIFRGTEQDYSIIRDSNKYGVHFTMLSLLISLKPIYIMDRCMSAWRCVVEDGAHNYTSMAKREALTVAENYFVMLKNFKKCFGDYYDYSYLVAKQFAFTCFLIIQEPVSSWISQVRRFGSYLSVKEFLMSMCYLIFHGVRMIVRKMLRFFCDYIY